MTHSGKLNKIRYKSSEWDGVLPDYVGCGPTRNINVPGSTACQIFLYCVQLTVYGYHFVVPSHSNITSQAQSYDIPPGNIILATGQPVFCMKLHFICRALDKGFSTTNLKYLV